MDVGLMQAWLRSSRDYQQGAQFLVESGEADDDELFLIELGETSVSRAHLVRAIERVVKVAIKTTKTQRTVKRKVITKADIIEELQEASRDPRSDGYDKLQLPAELDTVRQQIKADFKEMSYLRNRLELLPKQEDRYRSALRIAVLDGDISSAYARLDTWKATRRDPGASRAPERQQPDNPVALVKELRNLVSYLARHNTGARKVPDQKVLLWERRKKELEEMLADAT